MDVPWFRKVLTISVLAIFAISGFLFLIPHNAKGYDEFDVWSEDSYWKMKIKDNPTLHPNSAQMIDWLINEPNGGSEGVGVIINWAHWTEPIYDATPDTPRHTVYKDDGVTVGYYNVPIDSGWQPCAESDALMGIVDWENRHYYDFYHMRYEGGKWLADAEHRWSLDDYGTYFGCCTVGGSSTPFLAGVIRDEEIEAGVINHPISCCMHQNKKDTFVWPPAGRSDGKGTATYAIPMGARIQLDPSLDLDAYGLNPTAKIIAKALQDYGCVLKESGGAWALYAEHDLSANWDSNMGGGILKNIRFPESNWRVIDFTTYPPEDDLSEFELPSPPATYPPTYSELQHNTTKVSDPCLFSCKWEHPIGLSGYIFGTNNTGTWINETWASLSGTSAYAQATKTLNSTLGVRVEYAFWCNDTSDNWATTGTNFLITTTSTVTVDVINPRNMTYQSSSIPVQFNAFGGTIDTKWWNCKNGSQWVYANNRTYTKATTMRNFVDGSYTFYCWANNTDGNSDEQIVSFAISKEFFAALSLTEYNRELEMDGFPFLLESNGTITALLFPRANLLLFTVSAEGGSSTTTIYLQAYGPPVRVQGASSWSCDEYGQILTIIATHSSEVEIEVEWTPPIPSVSKNYGDTILEENAVLRTTSNNASLVMGDDLTFYRVVVDELYVWMDQSYTAKYYTLYCLYTTTDNASLTVHRWFPTKDSTGMLTINAPLSTDFNLYFYSPNLISASASGVVSYVWNSTTKILSMVANSNVNPIVISASVTETPFNIEPENVAVEITDLEGCGNWVFSQSEYYTFRASFWDGDGTADLDTMKIKFSDGATTVIAAYDQPETSFSLESGSDIVNLRGGTVTALDENLLQVDFMIYFKYKVIDALNVSIYTWCNDTSGARDGWDLLRFNYFSIYNLGGHSTLETYGNASRVIGGDVFDLYAWQDGWAKTSVIFRNLQHIKLLPTFYFVIGGGMEPYTVTWQVDYCTTEDDWIEGWKLVLKIPDPNETEIGSSVRKVSMFAEWYNRGSLIKNDTFYAYAKILSILPANLSMRLFVDMWFNRENASSTVGGRINAYYFVMKDGSNPWLRWLTGENWGPDEELPKESMLFTTLLDSDNNKLYAPQINLVRISSKVHNTAGGGYIQVADYDIFDLTVSPTDHFQGIQTPHFDETTVPVMKGWGGLLGTLWTAVNNLGKIIFDAMGPSLLSFWNTFVGFLDTVFGAFGWPNGFSTILGWIDSLKTWLVSSFGYLISLLTSVFALIMSFLGKMLNTLSVVVGQWVTIISGVFGMLGDTASTGFHLWNDLGMSTWVVIIAILYPMWLLFLWEQRGLDAVLNHLKMMMDILGWFANLFIGVIQLFLNLIGRIIESIPVVE